MSVVYTQKAFLKLFNEQFSAVQSYVSENPGKTVDDIASACTAPYEIAYAIIVQSGLVLLPNASGELQFGPKHGRP